jgi:ADP-ribose pyrophosphatase YjhB (NUDIX family)
VLKKLLFRVAQELTPICFNVLNVLLLGNLPPLGNACMVVEDQGRFLLLQRPEGMIVFPGGFIRWREYPEEAALREVREETGIEVRLLDTIGIYATKSSSLFRLSTLTIAFAGEVVGGLLKSSVEGRPYWMDEAEMRQRLARNYNGILEDYDAYRKRRALD